MSDEDLLGLARRALGDQDHAALLRLIALAVRGTSLVDFRERLLEFVRESASMHDTGLREITVRICKLCIAPEFYSGRMREDVSGPLVVILANDNELLTECSHCREMSSRYPEVMNYARRVAHTFWRFAGCPKEILR